MVAAGLSAADEAGRAEIERPPGAVDRAIVARATAEMTRAAFQDGRGAIVSASRSCAYRV